MSRLNKNLAMRQGDCNADDSPSESQRTLMPSDTSNRETAPPSGVQEVTEAMLDAAMAEYFGTESLRDLVSEKMIEAEREDMKKAIQAAIRAAGQVNAEGPVICELCNGPVSEKGHECGTSAPQTVRVPVDQLKHWAEYWNGSANEKAMSDALEHILGEVDELIRAAQESGQ